MKTAIALMASFIATPALAHGGTHMHPHGMESAVAFVIVAVIAALAAGFAIGRRGR